MPGVRVLSGVVPTAVVKQLADRLTDLAPLERYNLVSDTWAASLSGVAPLADVLRLSQALVASAETDPACGRWSSAPSACSTG